MITNKGKDIIAKYLIGQAPAYASYVAIGCGATPTVYSSSNVYAKSVLTSGSDPVLTNGLVTAKVVIKPETNNYAVGDTILVRDIDTFYDGQYVVTEVVSSGGQTTLSYLRTPGAYSTLTSSNIIGTVALAIDVNDEEVKPQLEKKNLDFEMFRVPIISRGYVTDNNLSQVVFTAELPTEERYEITEVGIYSAGANPSASNNDSRTLFSFAQSENWLYHGQTTSAIPYKPEALDEGLEANVLTVKDLAFQANANNSALASAARAGEKETLRYLNNAIVVRGDLSPDLTANGGATGFVPSSGHLALMSNHIHLAGSSLNLNKNALTDEIKIAFSTILRDYTLAEPDKVYLAIEFAHGESSDSPNARFETILDSIDKSNRYKVQTKQLKDLAVTGGFLWTSVQVVKIFVRVIPPTGNYNLALSSAVATGTQVTYTSAKSHNLAVGDVVTVTGFTSTGFNLTNKTITSTPTSRTFVVADTLAAGSSTGTNGTTQVAYKASDYFIGLDAIRLENTTTTSALYGMTGYSVIRNGSGQSIVKNPNTSNLIEFRFGVGVE